MPIPPSHRHLPVPRPTLDPPLTPLVLLVLGACRCDPGPAAPTDRAGDDTGGVEQVPGHTSAWTREEERAAGPVAFTELMYNDPADPQREWLELHNPLVLDLDLSGWTLAGGVEFTFPEGTVLEAGAYLVVAAEPSALAVEALGPYSGALSDRGERIELRSNGGRLIDTLEYRTDDPWPVLADGTGLSLSKLAPTDPSDRAERWTGSALPGGTPGADNGVDPLTPPTERVLLAADATWAYDDSGAPEPGWAAPDYADSAWARGAAPFTGGSVGVSAVAVLHITADNYYGAWLGGADGTGLRLIAEDPDGDWTTVETFEAEVGAEDHLYIAAWEAPWDYGGPQMVIAEVEVDGALVGTGAAEFEWVLGAAGACPGTSPSDPPPGVDELTALLSGAVWDLPDVEADRGSDPWAWALSGAFDAETRYIWPDTFSDTSITNLDNTYALFRSVDPLLGVAGATALSSVPVTTAFRVSFELDASPGAVTLTAECLLDDGAVFYLNGVEVLRENLPSGDLDDQTLASADVDGAVPVLLELPTDSLVRGQNVLAVKVHQAEREDPDLIFGCSLTAWVSPEEPAPTLRLNEVGAASEAALRVELDNPGSEALDPAGLVLVVDGEERVLDGDPLAPGELRAAEGPPAEAGQVLVLLSADRGAVLDAVRVSDRVRARDDTGAWRTPTAASLGEPNPIALEEDIVLNELMVHRAPELTEAGYAARAEEWIELYNRGDEAVDLGGWRLVDAVAWEFPEGTVLEPGALLVVSNDAEALQILHPEARILGNFTGSLNNRSERVLLLDAAGNPADEVRYADGGRWPVAADGGGASLELVDPRADNRAAEAWAASDESAHTAWQSFTLEGVAEPSAVGPDGTWQELVLGLLDAGEVLLDDLSVVQDPGGAAQELVQNGSFEDLDHWRVLGNHRHAEVVPDPDDPSNSVLRLTATGPTEHMHNHAETTLARPVTTTDTRVSFRARWVWGSNQLNSRLYFNRLPHTTLLEQPARAGTPGAPNSRAVENLGPTFADLRQDLAAPRPGQPVKVRVQVSDPDGVAWVRLWTSVDGGPFEAVEMAEDAEGWAARLEGQAGGSTVQLYVEAEDGLGQTATFPAAGAGSRVLVHFADPDEDAGGLHTLRLILTEEDSDWLHEDTHLMSNEGVRATVVYNEAEVFYDVEVRAKGSQRGRPTTVRLGFAVRFSPEQPFRGRYSSVLIDRSEGVGFGQREVLLNLVMARAGLVSAEYNDLVHVITPRPEHTGPAELQLDRSTSLMLRSQFERGDEGALYDYELIYYPTTTDDGTAEGLKLPQPDSVIGTAITDLGDDKEAYRWNFMLQNLQREDPYTALIGFCQSFSRRSSPGFLEEVAEVIDVDQWLRAFAMATLAGAVDNYGGDSAQHNARFYVRPSDGRVLYFPHDLDFFGSSTMAVVGNSDLRVLLQDPVYERGYYQHLDDLLSRAYTLDYLQPWCEQLAGLLPDQDFAENCAFVADRADWVGWGASDSVHQRFPAVDFAITTGGGADFSSSTAEVLLEGVAWVDVREIWLNGEPTAPTWTGGTTWQLSVPLQPGANTLELEAFNLAGEPVGSDAVVVDHGG